MRSVRVLALALLLPAAASAAPAPDDADDWKMIGGVLALVQQIVHQAVASPDGDAAGKSIDTMLAGKNAEANRLAAGAVDDVLQDMPAEQRAVFVALGRT